MLKSIRLQNFKSWHDTGPVRLGRLNMFFGANSSGKTSILQSLLLMRQTAESADRKRVFDTGSETDLVDLGTYSDIVFGRDVSNEMRIDVEWDSPRPVVISDLVAKAQSRKSVIASSRDLGFSTRISFENVRHPVREIEYRLGSAVFNILDEDGDGEYQLRSSPDYLLRAPGRRWHLRDPSKFYGFPDEVRVYYVNPDFLSDLELEFEGQLRRIRYLGPLRSDPQRQYIFSGGAPEDVGKRGELTVNALIASQREGTRRSRGFIKRRDGLRSIPRVSVEEVVAGWLKELGLIYDFDVRSVDDRETLYRVVVKRAADSPEVLLTDVGFGVSQILPVLTLLAYSSEGDTLVLEQPEIHLHPAVQARLADVLLETALVRNVQIIVESHSEHLLTRIQRRIAEGKFGKHIEVEPSDVALYFCNQQSGADGNGSCIDELELDLFGDISNWPQDFFGDPMDDLVARTRAAASRFSRP